MGDVGLMSRRSHPFTILDDRAIDLLDPVAAKLYWLLMSLTRRDDRKTWPGNEWLGRRLAGPKLPDTPSGPGYGGRAYGEDAVRKALQRIERAGLIRREVDRSGSHPRRTIWVLDPGDTDGYTQTHVRGDPDTDPGGPGHTSGGTRTQIREKKNQGEEEPHTKRVREYVRVGDRTGVLGRISQEVWDRYPHGEAGDGVRYGSLGACELALGEYVRELARDRQGRPLTAEHTAQLAFNIRAGLEAIEKRVRPGRKTTRAANRWIQEGGWRDELERRPPPKPSQPETHHERHARQEAEADRLDRESQERMERGAAATRRAADNLKHD